MMCKDSCNNKANTPAVTVDEPIERDQSIEVEIVEGTEAVDEFGEYWDDLFARAIGATPFLTRAWMSTFIEEGRIRGTPLFVLGWRDKKLVALLALEVRRYLKTKVAIPISTGKGFYLGLLLDPHYRSATERLANTIASARVFDVYVSIDLAAEDSTTNDLLDKLSKKGYHIRRISRNPSFGSQLCSSFDEYFKNTASAKSRQNLRRRERRLYEKHDVTVECYASENVTSVILRRIAAIEQRSWLKERGAAVLLQSFHQKLLLQMARAGIGTVWMMTIDGEDAAFEYVLVAHNQLVFGWRAFDLKHESSVSVGQILMMHTIRDACSRGIKSIDIGHGDAHYKRFWARDISSVDRIVAGRGLRGGLTAVTLYFVWRLAMVEWLRTTYRRMRKILRSSKQETAVR